MQYTLPILSGHGRGSGARPTGSFILLSRESWDASDLAAKIWYVLIPDVLKVESDSKDSTCAGYSDTLSMLIRLTSLHQIILMVVHL